MIDLTKISKLRLKLELRRSSALLRKIVKEHKDTLASEFGCDAADQPTTPTIQQAEKFLEKYDG